MEADNKRVRPDETTVVDLFNLDELERLNPDPIAFTVNGRQLLINELSHKEYIRVTHRMAQLQDIVREAQAALAGARPASHAMEGYDDAAREILMELFGPFNPWLTELDDEAASTALRAWQEKPAEEQTRGPEPRRRTGVFFDDLSERKLTYLSTKAFEVQQGFVEPEVQRAEEAGVATAPFEKALSNGAPSMSESASGSR